MSTAGWVALVLVLLTVAPLALVLLFAVLRGYTVDMHLHRKRKVDEGDEE